jgi:hypothetical protein
MFTASRGNNEEVFIKLWSQYQVIMYHYGAHIPFHSRA